MNTKWVFACGMRRAGSTVQYHLAREIVKSAGGVDLSWVTWQGFDKLYNEYDGKYPYAVLKCHAFIPGMATRMTPEVWDSQGYGVYISRDIRDVLASLIRLYKKRGAGSELEQSALKSDMRAIFLGEGGKWLSKTKVLHTRYESILHLDGLARECARISAHLDVDMSWVDCMKLAVEYDLEKQRSRLPIGQNQYNKEYLFWNNHLFTGANGTWVTELTRAQIDFCNGLEEISRKELRRG